MAKRSTTKYVVYRCGSSNAYNTLGPVGVYDGTGVTARDRRDDAILQASDDGAITYVNQYLDAIPYARASADDVAVAIEAQEVRQLLRSEALAAVR